MATTRKKSSTKKSSTTAKRRPAPASPSKPAKKAASSRTASAQKGSSAKAGARPAAAKAKPARAPKREAVATPASQRVALAIAEAALDKKAVNVEIIDVAGKVDYADYVVVMSGTSDRQVNALARGIAEDVEKKTKTKCLGVEGLPGGAWVLMDFGDVVVHIFHHDVRGYYDLESLWIDAARVPVPGAASPS